MIYNTPFINSRKYWIECRVILIVLIHEEAYQENICFLCFRFYFLNNSQWIKIREGIRLADFVFFLGTNNYTLMELTLIKLFVVETVSTQLNYPSIY